MSPVVGNLRGYQGMPCGGHSSSSLNVFGLTSCCTRLGFARRKRNGSTAARLLLARSSARYFVFVAVILARGRS